MVARREIQTLIHEGRFVARKMTAVPTAEEKISQYEKLIAEFTGEDVRKFLPEITECIDDLRTWLNFLMGMRTAFDTRITPTVESPAEEPPQAQ